MDCRWREELLEPWLAALQSPEVVSHFQAVEGCGPDAAAQHFDQGIALAVDMVHRQCGRVIVRSKGASPQRPANGWYDRTCAEARHTLRAAEREHGKASEAAKRARKAYRVVVGVAKAQFEQAEQDTMLEQMYSNPKAFWKTFKGRGTVQVPGSVAECTAKFRSLFGGGATMDFQGGSLGTHCAHHAELFPEPSSEDTTRAEHLNREFDVDEVQLALGLLADHKSARGLPAEFLSKAWLPVRGEDGRVERQYVLGPWLVQLLNAVLCSGSYPQGWQTSCLVPVPKPRADPLVLDGYRGIAVGEVLAKIYALCLHNRLDPWAEDRAGTRAAGQAGFRRERSTSDNTFVLRHLIDASACKRAPLYVAFVDFSKAYDRVDRAMLWRVLAGMGVHGRALAALQAMYASVTLQVRVAGQLGEPFGSEVGVKQGCPLSPLLFGIFIDRLEPFLAAKCGAEGALLAGALVRVLLYADDVALVATSAAGLQRLLDALDLFCSANGMLVNQSKSQVVVFNSRFGSRARPAFACGSLVLEHVRKYQYLGLWFEDDSSPPDKKPLRGSMTFALGKATAAMRALLARAAKIKLHNTNALGHLFDTLVRSVASAGCEAWGVDHVSKVCKARVGPDLGKGQAETMQYSFWQQVWGLPKSTACWPLLREAGERQPLNVFWLRMAAKLWNRALLRPPGDLLAVALRENVGLLDCAPRAEASLLWASHFTACLRSLDVAWQSDSGRLVAVNAKALARRAMDRWQAKYPCPHESAAWLQAPLAVRAAPQDFSSGFVHLKHRLWFQAGEGFVRKQSAMFHLDRPKDIRAVMRFKLGSAKLAVNEGRFGSRRNRNERICPCCQGGVEDELHLWECPIYAGVRTRHPNLCTEPAESWTDAGFCARVNGQTKQHWVDLARFLRECESVRSNHITSLCPPEA